MVRKIVLRRSAARKVEKQADRYDNVAGADASWRTFSAMKDEDFFSSRVQHLYLYGPVTDESVDALIADIRAASQSSISPSGMQMSPKPIVLHINSPGGSVTAAMSMATVFNQTHVPICTMVDGMSASAATVISVMAPYRVAASPHTFTLVHQYSTFLYGTQTQLQVQKQIADEMIATFRDMYLHRTKLKGPQLDELMLRDLCLDTAVCVRYGILDRVLNVDNRPFLAAYARQRAEYLTLDISRLFTKTNWNSFHLSSCGDVVQRMDEILTQDAANMKPIVVYCTPRCQDELSEYHWIALASRVRALRVPAFSVVDSLVDIWTYVPSLFCTKRYMYEHSIIVIDLEYSVSWGRRLIDIIDNSQLMVRWLQDVLRAKTKLPSSVVDSIGKRPFKFNAREALKYGLADEIVQLKYHRDVGPRRAAST